VRIIVDRNCINSEFWIGMISWWIEYMLFWNGNESDNEVKEIDNSRRIQSNWKSLLSSLANIKEVT